MFKSTFAFVPLSVGGGVDAGACFSLAELSSVGFISIAAVACSCKLPILVVLLLLATASRYVGIAACFSLLPIVSLMLVSVAVVVGWLLLSCDWKAATDVVFPVLC